MSRQHDSADRRRAHSAGQRKISHYCRCDPARVFVGNAAWASHRRANPGHQAATTREHYTAAEGR